MTKCIYSMILIELLYFLLSVRIELLAILQYFTVVYPSFNSRFIIIMYQLYSRKWICIKKICPFKCHCTFQTRSGHLTLLFRKCNRVFISCTRFHHHTCLRPPLHFCYDFCWGGGDH